MRCFNCNKNIEDDTKICPFCGANVDPVLRVHSLKDKLIHLSGFVSPKYLEEVNALIKDQVLIEREIRECEDSIVKLKNEDDIYSSLFSLEKRVEDLEKRSKKDAYDDSLDDAVLEIKDDDNVKKDKNLLKDVNLPKEVRDSIMESKKELEETKELEESKELEEAKELD